MAISGARSARCFFAVELPSGIKQSLSNLSMDARKAFVDAGGSTKIVPEENFHITLLFLGDVEERFISEITGQQIRDAVNSILPTPLTVAGCGAFPNLRHPSIVWTGITSGEQYLQAVHDTLRQSIAAVGVSFDDKRYSPHITLLRVKDQAKSNEPEVWLRERAALEVGVVESPRVVLYKSVLRPQGPIYTPLTDFAHQ